MFNFASQVLKHLFFQDLDVFFHEHLHEASCSVSPLTEAENTGVQQSADFILIVTNPARSYNIEICAPKFTGEMLASFSNYLSASLYRIELVLSILCNFRYHAALHGGPARNDRREPDTTMLNMEISPFPGGPEAALSVRVPKNFFRLFSPGLSGEVTPESVENGIKSFFRDPSHLFPGISMILDTFSDRELQELLFQLQKKNLLTPYQICLVLLAFPEKALRLKNNVSRNTILDVTAMMRRYRGGGAIQKRDITGGLYSIEEAVYFLIREGIDFSYSSFLSGLQKTVTMMSRFELLLLRDFSEWVVEMDESGLLYKTLSATTESDIAGAISEDPGKYIPLFSRYISERKIADITRLAETRTVSFTERVTARTVMIHNYRQLGIQRRNFGDESFEYLLRRFSSPRDYRHLLFAAGWFPLSTALKGLSRARIKPVLDNLPRPARYLIEDVLKGIVNPGIIHDELQVHSARRLCVQTIAMLSKDGMIELIE